MHASKKLNHPKRIEELINVPKDSEQTHLEATPHFDEKRDRIISDPFGAQMGIRMDRSKKNPYNAANLNHDEMKAFESLMRGNKIKSGKQSSE